jgi:hypothetical protein
MGTVIEEELINSQNEPIDDLGLKMVYVSSTI